MTRFAFALFATLALVPSLAVADYKATVLADNPVVYWQMYETAGNNTADDATANNRDGSWTSCDGTGPTHSATAVTNEAGARSAYVNNELAKCVGRNDENAFDFGTGAFSVEMWIRPDGTGSWNTFATHYDTYQSNGWLIVSNSGTNRFCVWMNNAVRACFSSDYVVGTDYHVVMVRSGNNTTIYQNAVAGTVNSTLSSYNETNSGKLTVFAGGGAFGTNSDAFISDFALYNVALTGTQITTHYNCGNAGTSCVSSGRLRRLLYGALDWFLAPRAYAAESRIEALR